MESDGGDGSNHGGRWLAITSANGNAIEDEWAMDGQWIWTEYSLFGCCWREAEVEAKKRRYTDRYLEAAPADLAVKTAAGFVIDMKHSACYRSRDLATPAQTIV